MKKLNPLMICHMVLMVLLLGFSLFSAVVLIGGIGIPPEVFTGREKTVIQLRGIFNIVNISAICCGIVYLWNEYSVKAEVYYKYFLIFHVVESLLLFGLDIAFTEWNISLALSLLSLVIKVVILMVFIFRPDMERKKTWILFSVLILLDIGGIIPTFFYTAQDGMLYRIIGSFSRLVLGITIGFAIHGRNVRKNRALSK